MVQGLPVIIATNGRGIAVTETDNGLPVEAATNGFGIPVIVTAVGGLPVTFVGELNLLDGLSWIQGTDTTMSIAGGRVRATATIGNPRVYKTVTGLTIGETYHLSGNVWDGTGTGVVFFRVSTTANLPDGNNYEQSDLVDFAVNADFVSTATTLSIGIVKSVSNTGEWAEIDEDFSLTVAP